MKLQTVLITSIIFLATKTYSQCACCAGASMGSSNNDCSAKIMGLQKKQLIIESFGDYRTISNHNDHGETGHSHNHTNANPTDSEIPLQSMLINSLGLRYGFSNKISIAAFIPFVFLKTQSGNDKGLGDMIILGNMNILLKTNINLSIQSGIELPTGIQKKSHFDNTTAVIGSGSYDPIFGIQLTKNWNKVALFCNGLYKHTTAGFGSNYYGSLSTQNLSIMYKVFPKEELSMATDSVQASSANYDKFNFIIAFGYYGEWLDNITENNVIDINSGYYLGFATLGVNLNFKKWSFPLTYSYPLIQQINGNQNHAGYRLRFGLSKTF